MSLEETYSPSSFTYFNEILRKALIDDQKNGIEKQQSVTIEVEQSIKSGRYHYAEVTFSFIRDKNGKPTALLGVTRDITERKLAEQALRESEELYRLHFENISDVIYSLDPEFRILNVSPSIKKHLGYTREEVIGKTFIELNILAPEYIESAYSDAVRVLSGEQAWGIYEFITKDGKRIFGEVSGAPLIKNGKVVATISVGRDITERKEAEKALLESESKYRQLVQFAPAGIYEFDMEQLKFINVNDVMCEYTGYTREEFLNLNPFDLLLEESVEILKKLLEEVASGNQNPVPVEYKIRGKNNREFWVLVNSKFFFENGKPRRAMAVVHDMSEIRKTEEEKARLEAQLRQAQKMEAIGTLSGGIAHDFNNLLVALLGNTELALLDVSPGTSINKYLEQIRKASLRAKDLVQQILAFSRKTEETRRPLRMTLIVDEALRMLRASLPTTIEIRKRFELSGDVINADPTQINQIMINLCTNAAQAMKDGGIIEIHLNEVFLRSESILSHSKLIPGTYIKLSVIDTGEGIDPETMGRIFDPYFTTKEKESGTGLGLTVVHGIVNSLGGGIDVQSELGKGTVFDIYFLKADENEIEIDTPDDSVIPTGKERILLVDDEESIIDIGSEILERLGYRVTTYMRSEEALHRFHKDPKAFDLVITDMTMPKMTGDRLARELLKIRPELPIVICTGFSERITEEEAKDMGIKAFAMKPLSVKNLARTVRNVLDEATS